MQNLLYICKFKNQDQSKIFKYIFTDNSKKNMYF